MSETEALLTRLFEAYNRRDFPAFSACLREDVDWPDQAHGGRLVGYGALRDYWNANDRSIQVEMTPIVFAIEGDGRIRVDINQVVRGATGGLWSDIKVRQYFTFCGDRVSRMDLEAAAEPGGTT